MSMNLNTRVKLIERLFDTMHGNNASDWQRTLVAVFRQDYPELNEDLDFCFEVLAGKHKLGFTVYDTEIWIGNIDAYNTTIKDLMTALRYVTELDKSESNIYNAITRIIPIPIRPFVIKLANREYRLGYTNRNNMVTDKHCMLAKSYPEAITTTKQYYIQEKLNGNRCIAYFEDGRWQFISRSQKPMKVNFDMTGFNTDRVYDGEIMARDKMNNRDFSRTSGLINAKYADKSELVYFVYDILDDQMSYKDRRAELVELKGKISPAVQILKVLDKVTVYPDVTYNHKLDEWLDYIVDRGGEGIMLRDPDAPYYHSKHSGDRKNYLIKYKKLKTCDLRIVGWNYGKGKYTDLIGSFICEDDQKTISVNVAGMTDEVRCSDPYWWLDKIIEVAYFETSQSKSKDTKSLQFPRMKRLRDDKTETSLY